MAVYLGYSKPEGNNRFPTYLRTGRMLLAIEKLPSSMEFMSTYRFFHLTHDYSIESLHSLVLNDVHVERAVARASTDFGFGIITKDEFVKAINTAITDRNSLRQMIDSQVHFTEEQKETVEREFQRILLTQIHNYLRVAKQDLTDAGLKHTVTPGVGLSLVP
jgi:hypothetical protein